MRRVLQTVSVAVCLTVAAEAPRGFLLAAVVAGLGIARTLYAQQASEPRFDVVSVKLNRSPEPGGRNALEPGIYQGIGVTVRRIIALAYMPLPPRQIVDGPSWIGTDRFDVQAKFSGSPSREQVQGGSRAPGAPPCAFQYTEGLLRGRGVTLEQIAAELVAGRVVINRTGSPERMTSSCAGHRTPRRPSLTMRRRR